MTIAKNIEVSCTSKLSFEDAIQKAITKICKTVNGVQGAWIKEQKVSIDNGNIAQYHVIMIVSFVLDGDDEIA